MTGLLEGPVYTKPRVWRGRGVPAVLLSGNHAAIARWRRDAALRRTAQMRPEMVGMLDPAALDDRDREVLSEAGFPVRSEDVAH
jgi:tRNA (guanine37-N1)-methyltransferase